MYELIHRLPSRERRILELSIQGYDTKEIAKQTGMEYNTVRHYKKRRTRKSGKH
ncbi:MAG: sigma factor-like helix-turn-helix DNA-binding protein [Butyricimonas faecalis]